MLWGKWWSKGREKSGSSLSRAGAIFIKNKRGIGLAVDMGSGIRMMLNDGQFWQVHPFTNESIVRSRFRRRPSNSTFCSKNGRGRRIQWSKGGRSFAKCGQDNQLSGKREDLAAAIQLVYWNGELFIAAGPTSADFVRHSKRSEKRRTLYI